MGFVFEYYQLISKYLSNPNIYFFVIYLRESHAIEGWQFNDNVKIHLAQSISDRKNGLDILIDEWKTLSKDIKFNTSIKSMKKDLQSKDLLNIKCNMLMDNMNDDLRRLFESAPERLYVIKNNTVIFKGGAGPFFYQISHVDTFLNTQT